jgi:hypothetical protein
MNETRYLLKGLRGERGDHPDPGRADAGITQTQHTPAIRAS